MQNSHFSNALSPFGMFDRIMDELVDTTRHITTKARQNGYSYPPHNVVELSDGNIQLAIAVAGFKKSEISIQVDTSARRLIITGSKQDDKTSPVTYLYKSLSTRSFELKWRIPESLEVQDDAKIEDGVLQITLKKVEPRVDSVKKFTII